MMINSEKIRADFPVLKEKMNGNPLIYFDNGATTLKPQSVIDEIVMYYSKLSTNAHRGDYELSYKVDVLFDASRNEVANFINALKHEVVFTSGATEAINIISNGFAKKFFKAGDEIIINYAEHASNVLPWFDVAKSVGAKIVFCPLDENHTLTLDNLISVVSSKTKLICVAHTTNTIGDTRDIKEICKYAVENDIYTLIDGSQSVPHQKIDVKDLNCDFFVFSAHKMCGPTGIGALYGKEELLKLVNPHNYGGGMNARFNIDNEVSLKNIPTVLEAGTQNIAGVIGFSKAIKYLNEIGLDNIEKYEQDLKQYALSKLKRLPNVKLYNETTSSGLLLFNVFDNDQLVFPQDVASYLSTFGIAIRSGDHCAKLLNNELDTRVTCRASFYFYNTKNEIDTLVDALEKCNTESVLLF